MNEIQKYTNGIVNVLISHEDVKDDPFIDKDILTKIIKKTVLEKLQMYGVGELHQTDLHFVLNETRVICVFNTCVDLAEKDLLNMCLNNDNDFVFTKKQ